MMIWSHEPFIDRYIEFVFARLPHEKKQDGETPLIEAAGNGDEASVFLLLRYMFDVSLHHEKQDQILNYNQNSYRKRTALHVAAQRGLGNIVQLLLKHPQTKIGLEEETGWTPFAHAVFFGQVLVAKMLLENVRVSVATTTNGTSARDVDVYNGLLRWKDLSYGQTLLHHAVVTGHQPMVELLLESGVDVNARDSFQRSALHEAVRDHDRISLEHLLRWGADLEAKDSNGSTTLDLAVSLRACPNAVSVLLKGGADVNARDNKGRTDYI
jgi:ankyrin repeat protein